MEIAEILISLHFYCFTVACMFAAFITRRILFSFFLIRESHHQRGDMRKPPASVACNLECLFN